jgi:hypothetical protein
MSPSEVDFNTFTMDNPMPESTLTLCHIRLYPPDRGLWPQVLVVFRVDHVPDVSGHVPEKQGLYDAVQRVRFQGDELVHQGGGFVGAQAWAVQQAGGIVGGAEAEGPQQKCSAISH